ncbi:MAG: ATP:cob(I)alamin adenosyltransferase [Elusimicrobium sp.]|jgi:cob(I)alamin adenosyltransferase|nr:ATP:cob(I)alamin adenosyltransferase [Elusimicrobium sp.]
MRKGDVGLTDLIGETSVKKSDPRVRTLAYLDDLTSALGYAKLKSKEADLAKIQTFLISVCAAVAGGKDGPAPKAVNFIETKTAALEEKYKMPKTFVLSGKTEAEAALHIARAKCRLAETYITELPLRDPDILRFINRLSRYLFLLALKYS